MMCLDRRVRLLATAISVAALAACGGGSDAPAEQKISGVTSFGVGATVCADLDQNFRCDAAEPAAVANAEGRYEILVASDVDVASLLLVSEPDAAKGDEEQAPRLASVAGWSGELNALSTLVAAKVLDGSAANADIAYAQIESAFGMAQGVSLKQSWSSLEGLAQSALKEAAQVVHAQTGAAEDSLPVMTQGAAAVVQSLGRYVDGVTGQPLPSVSSHFVNSDVRGTLGLDFCLVPQVQHLTIVTDDGAPILDKENYLRAQFSVQGANGETVAESMGGRIRGRGNSTWEMPKKPYRVKLDDAAGLLGMSSTKDWTLLANYADKSLLRNELAFCLARTLGMPYTAQSRFVEITLNGEYIGQYQLTNRTVELEDELKAVSKQDGVNTDAPLEEFNDVFLIEVDERLDSDFWFRTQTTIPYAIQTDSDAAQTARIERWFNYLEDVLRVRGVAQDRVSYVSQYIDLESLVDFALVNELTKNNDVFFSSTNVYRNSPTGKLQFGPVWDFDIAASNNNTDDFLPHPHGWYLPTRFNAWYFNTLMEEAPFRALREARWKYLSSQMNRIDEFLKQTTVAMEDSQSRNFARWPILNEWVWPNVVVLGSHEAEVRYLREWLAERAQWMDQNVGEGL